MTFSLHSPPSTNVASSESENDNPPSPSLFPKRSFSFTDEDDSLAGTLGHFKRRHVYNESEVVKRAPLDPLSASQIDNRPRPRKVSAPPESSFHSIGSAKAPSKHSIPSGGSTCLWPPAIMSDDADSMAGSNSIERPPINRSARYSPDSRESCGTLAAGSAPAWPPPPRNRSDLPSPEGKQSRWDVDDATPPARLRSSSIPYMRRPTGDYGKTGPASEDPARTIYGLVDDHDSIFTTPPLGLANRSCSESDVDGCSSLSLSLATGSQPLGADESPKVIPPIGAERRRGVSATSRRSKSLPPARLPSIDEVQKPHLRLKSNGARCHDNNARLLGVQFIGILEQSTSDASIAEDELNRLLRHTVLKKHGSKVFSPLSPLRNPAPPLSLTADPAYKRYLPSLTNAPSLRYTREPDLRFRNLCDISSIELESDHCRECKRDTLGKRLLARQYCQMRGNTVNLLTSPATPDVWSPMGASPGGMDGDAKRPWEEVAAATSTSIPVSPHLQDLHDFGDGDGNDDEEEDTYPEIPGEDPLSDGK